MISAPVRRFTVDEYHSLAEAGVLHEGDRVELLDGYVVDMMPIGPSHGGAVDWLAESFGEASRRRWITRVQSVVRLGEHDEPQPDLLLLRRDPSFYRHSHPGPIDVFLVIEVSDSSLLVDREAKVPLYAQAGIPEMWIVNLPERIVEVYRQPEHGVYTLRHKVRPGEHLAPLAFPDATIDTSALLGAQGE